MAVARHGSLGTRGTATCSTTETIASITVPSVSNGYLVARVYYEQDTAQAVLTGVNAPDLDGAAFEFIGKIDGTAGSTNEDIELWGLAAPASGSGKTFTIKLNDSGQDFFVELVLFTGVEPGVSFGTPVTATDSAGTDGVFTTPGSLTATENDSAIVCAAVANDAARATATAGGSLTEDLEGVVGASGQGFTYWGGYQVGLVDTTAYTVTCTFAGAVTNRLALIAVELLPAAAAATFPVPYMARHRQRSAPLLTM